MGRKIPGKKHRGIKDPAVQHAKRFESLKSKINAPPTNPDTQDVPKSLLQIMELKQKVKDGIIGKRKKKGKRKRKQGPVTSELLRKNKNVGVAESENNDNEKKKFKGKYSKPVPVFTQLPDENNSTFMKRVNRIVQEVLKESEFEQKYGVDVKRNPNTGEVEEVVKKPKDEIDALMRKAKKEALNPNKKKKKVARTERPRLTKSEKRKRKLLLKKQNKNEKEDDGFSRFKDEVKFGETAYEPPKLVKPRKATDEGTSRPGQNDLLLKKMFNSKSEAKANKSSNENVDRVMKIKKTNSSIDKKGKRKDLPAATRKILEMQRNQAVNAYKQLKADRNKLLHR